MSQEDRRTQIAQELLDLIENNGLPMSDVAECLADYLVSISTRAFSVSLSGRVVANASFSREEDALEWASKMCEDGLTSAAISDFGKEEESHYRALTSTVGKWQ